MPEFWYHVSCEALWKTKAISLSEELLSTNLKYAVLGEILLPILIACVLNMHVQTLEGYLQLFRLRKAEYLCKLPVYSLQQSL